MKLLVTATPLDTRTVAGVKAYLELCKKPTFTEASSFVSQNVSLFGEDLAKRLSDCVKNIKGASNLNIVHREVAPLKAAFDDKFIDNDGVMVDFNAAVINTANDFATKADFLAPVVAMVQASGVGKSRVCLERGKQSLSVYVCLRDFKSSGYPPRSVVASLFTPSKNNVRRVLGCFSSVSTAELYVAYYLNLVIAFMLTLEKMISDGAPLISCEEVLDMQCWKEGGRDNNGDFTTFYKELLSKFKSWLSFISTCDNKHIAKFTLGHQLYLKPYMFLETMTQKLRSVCDGKGLNSQRILTFIVDECHVLLNPVEQSSQSFYHYFRMAASFMPKQESMRLAFVVLDTYGSISDYTPIILPDQSLRFLQNKKLFPSFVRLPFQTVDMTSLPSGDLSLLDLKRFGRYLWKTYDDEQTLLQVAQAKLCGPKWINDRDATETVCLAILGARLAVDYHAQEQLAYDLVRSHGAYLYYITDDRKYANVGYVNDPVLATAAASVTRLNEDAGFITWKRLLTALKSYIASGIVEAGYKGELLVKCILLMCKDSFQEPVTKVKDFLNSLYGPTRLEAMNNAFDSEEAAKLLMDGTINFNHFVYVTELPPKKFLAHYYSLRMGIFCKRNQELVDLMIVVKLGNGEYSLMLVQVKNYEKGLGLPQVPENIVDGVYSQTMYTDTNPLSKKISDAKASFQWDLPMFAKLKGFCKNAASDIESKIRSRHIKTKEELELAINFNFAPEKHNTLRDELRQRSLKTMFAQCFADALPPEGTTADELKKKRQLMRLPHDFGAPYLYLYFQVGSDEMDWSLLGRDASSSTIVFSGESPDNLPKNSVWAGSFGVSKEVFHFLKAYPDYVDLLCSLRLSWYDPKQSLARLVDSNRIEMNQQAFTTANRVIDSVLFATSNKWE
jgi:hypothetical protein